jgi:hypothetical protein
MTSTVYLELLAALQHVDIDCPKLKTSVDYSCQVLNMRATRPTIEDAPPDVRDFIHILQDDTIDTSKADWVKTARINGMLIFSWSYLYNNCDTNSLS